MTKHTLHAVLALLLFAASTSAQQIKIDPALHVANVGKGFCGHCCIETATRHLGFKEAVGRVAKQHKRLGDTGGGLFDEEVCLILQSYHIAYYWQAAGCFRHDWLHFACSKGFPCIVQLKPVAQGKLGHYVLVVGHYSDWVAVVDSNQAGRTRWIQRELFDDWWVGDLILIYPWYDK